MVRFSIGLDTVLSKARVRRRMEYRRRSAGARLSKALHGLTIDAIGVQTAVCYSGLSEAPNETFGQHKSWLLRS